MQASTNQPQEEKIEIPAFLKWAGGKSKLIPQFEKFFPKEITNYYEPFLGSGAVFFYIKQKYNPEKITLSDKNLELINCFKMVQKKPEELIALLKTHRKKHSKDYYYRVRAQNPSEMPPLERAARLIYLNKTCFNGLYRVNSKGQFNVPFGYYKNPGIVNEVRLRKASELLQGVAIKAMDFERLDELVEKGDFVYFDPPYYPISKTSSFTQYNGDLFTEAEQVRLLHLFEKLDKKGCKLMLSNSSADFIKELYKEYRIETVFAKRVISCDASTRGEISEVVVLNYQPSPS